MCEVWGLGNMQVAVWGSQKSIAKELDHGGTGPEHEALPEGIGFGYLQLSNLTVTSYRLRRKGRLQVKLPSYKLGGAFKAFEKY